MKKTTAALLTLVIIVFSMASCSAKKEYKRGTLTSTTFESEYLNLKFTLPDGFTMATEDEMKKMSSKGAQVMEMNSELFNSAMENMVYEMQAVSTGGYPNVIVMAEKLQLQNMTIDSYVDALKQQLTNVKSIKYTINTGKEKTSIAGQDYTTLTASATYATLTLTQDYYVRIQDGRAISFVFTYTSETAAKKDTLFNAFKEFK
jgi:hypothetical protein